MDLPTSPSEPPRDSFRDGFEAALMALNIVSLRESDDHLRAIQRAIAAARAHIRAEAASVVALYQAESASRIRSPKPMETSSLDIVNDRPVCSRCGHSREGHAPNPYGGSRGPCLGTAEKPLDCECVFYRSVLAEAAGL